MTASSSELHGEKHNDALYYKHFVNNFSVIPYNKSQNLAIAALLKKYRRAPN